MYKHRVKRMGGGGSYTHFLQSFFKDKSLFTT